MHCGGPSISVSLGNSLTKLMTVATKYSAISPASTTVVNVTSNFVMMFNVRFVSGILGVSSPINTINIRNLGNTFNALTINLFSSKSNAS